MANVIGTVPGEPGRVAHRDAHTVPSSQGRRVLWRSERGAVAAELVIATPLLLLLIMGVIQFALWEHAVHIATAVAQQGVSVGRLQGESVEAGQAEARSVLDQLGTTVLSGTTITVTKTAQMTTVTVTGHAESIVGIFSLPVAATASGASESFTPPGQAP
jgi:Flp pilus assembly protein TadG